METDPLTEALHEFSTTGPEYSSYGLSNHGPMVVEVLDQLGQADAIEGWVANYRPRLEPAPPPAQKPLGEGEWPDALGQSGQYPEWLMLFETEMADRPVAAVVAEWVPRLLPGAVAAATHGLIRTAHGLRGLHRADTAARRLEVATGLAYWASHYQELPGPPLLIGHQDVPAALADLPYLPDDMPEEFNISARVAHVADISDEFEQAVASLGHSGDALSLIDALAVGGARAYLRNADGGHAVALIHSVTAPLALELVLPWLAPEDRDAALGYAWQAVASLHVAYDIDRQKVPADDRALPSRDGLIELALASGDVHALKVTEATLRSFDRTGESDLLRVAADAVSRLSD
jgi:Questin oxidase-like